MHTAPGYGGGGISTLQSIQAEVQRVAEAVAAALGVEVEIVDEDLTIVGGTGKYARWIGFKEEEGRKEDGFIYGQVLTTGRYFIVPDPNREPIYGESVARGPTQELAEVCCPIALDDGRIIGVIGLVALDQSQRQRLLQEPSHMLAFVQRMADLLASRVRADLIHQQLLEASAQLEAIIATIHDGLLSVDRSGQVTHCNQAAEVLLGLNRQQLIGRPVMAVMPGTGIPEVLGTSTGYVEREEVFTRDGKTYHMMMTVTPIGPADRATGSVVVFRDIGQVRRLVYNFALEAQAQSFADIKGTGPALRQVLEQARRVAQSPATVLITGESGTGKDLLARAIHHAGPNRKGPFIAVNCGALPEQLLESELFGYQAGAFTGARREGKPGKFELADGGTLFLDEMGDMPLHLQVTLLHVLQRREVTRIGGTRPIPVNVRVITATNRDLEQMVREGQFRADLYYRINVIPLHMPPLRERPEDIPLLLDHFLQVHANRLGRLPLFITPAVREAFMMYNWPGNVRELENAVEYAVNVAVNDQIHLDCLPLWLKRCQDNLQSGVPANALAVGTLKGQVEGLERKVLQEYLAAYGRDKKALEQIGSRLGLSRATLYRKLGQYGLLSQSQE